MTKCHSAEQLIAFISHAVLTAAKAINSSPYANIKSKVYDLYTLE